MLQGTLTDRFAAGIYDFQRSLRDGVRLSLSELRLFRIPKRKQADNTGRQHERDQQKKLLAHHNHLIKKFLASEKSARTRALNRMIRLKR
jgi:hypothetical protein